MSGLARRGQVPVADPAGLPHRLRVLPGQVRSQALLAATASTDDGQSVTHVVTAVGTSAGLWLAQARTGDDPDATLQQVAQQDSCLPWPCACSPLADVTCDLITFHML